MTATQLISEQTEDLTISCASEDERAAMLLVQRGLRQLRRESVLLILRDEDLHLRAWMNGQPSGSVQLKNLIPAWRPGGLRRD